MTFIERLKCIERVDQLIRFDLCAEVYRLPQLTYEWGFSTPPDGDNVLRISNSSWGSGNFNTEYAATELESSLEAGRYYLFEGLVNNKGFHSFRDRVIYDCVGSPFRHYTLVVSKEKIELTQNFSSESSAITGREIARNDSMYISSQFPSNWKKVRHCFQAEGGEKHFGITGAIGTFELQEECKGNFSTNKNFHGFLYEFDNIQLYEVPKSDAAEQTICSDEPTPACCRKRMESIVPSSHSKEASWKTGRINKRFK